MHFNWIDYPASYATQIETWCSKVEKKFTLNTGTVQGDHQENLEDDRKLNYNYFCKIAMEEDIPVALVMLIIDEDNTKQHISDDIIWLDSFIINPALRNKGYGQKVIQELLENPKDIINGSEKDIFCAQIHKYNAISQKLMQKLGFYLAVTSDLYDDDWQNWVYPATAVAPFCAMWEELD